MTATDRDDWDEPVFLSDFVPLSTITRPFFPGLYAFLGENDDVLYIGRSGDVRARVRQHRSKRWFPDVRKTHVLPLVGEQSQLYHEALLQLRHRPRHCRAIKLGINRDGTLTELQFLRCKK